MASWSTSSHAAALLCVLALRSVTSSSSAPLPPGALQLVLLEDAARAYGAVSLDGTPAAYYIRPGAETRKWIVHQTGGGWCSSDILCAQRSNTTLGSSSSFPPVVAWNVSGQLVDQQGYLTPDSTINPLFWNWTTVVLQYTDGSSQTGNVEPPIIVPGWPNPIYYRGARVLRAYLESLLEMGMGQATDIVYSGCSAGGLSVFLHIDSFAAAVRSVNPAATVVGMPDSGFFLEFGTVYPPRMNWTFWAHNASGTLNPACLASFPPEERYRCLFAQHVVRFTTTPMLALQSYYDSYQIAAIGSCNTTNATCVNAFGSVLKATLEDTITAVGPRFGSAMDACSHHCSRNLWTGMGLPSSSGAGGNTTEAGAMMQWLAQGPGSNEQRVWEQQAQFPCAQCCTGGSSEAVGTFSCKPSDS